MDRDSQPRTEEKASPPADDSRDAVRPPSLAFPAERTHGRRDSTSTIRPQWDPPPPNRDIDSARRVTYIFFSAAVRYSWQSIFNYTRNTIRTTSWFSLIRTLTITGMAIGAAIEDPNCVPSFRQLCIKILQLIIVIVLIVLFLWWYDDTDDDFGLWPDDGEPGWWEVWLCRNATCDLGASTTSLQEIAMATNVVPRATAVDLPVESVVTTQPQRPKQKVARQSQIHERREEIAMGTDDDSKNQSRDEDEHGNEAKNGVSSVASLQDQDGLSTGIKGNLSTSIEGWLEEMKDTNTPPSSPPVIRSQQESVLEGGEGKVLHRSGLLGDSP